MIKNQLYFNRLPLSITNRDIKVITKDNFTDWNLQFIMAGFKDLLESIHLKKQIFEFPFLFNTKKIIDQY